MDNFKSKFNLESTDLFFAFKGGNILRLVYKQTLNELPNLVSKKLKSFYDAFFKRSDADFSIYLNPFLENYASAFQLPECICKEGILHQDCAFNLLHTCGVYTFI